MTRRELLTGAAAATASPTMAAPAYKPVLAVQTYVWTQHFRAQNKTLAEGLDECFAATRRAGYRRMELVSNFVAPDLRERTMALLKQHSLKLDMVYNGGPMHTPEGAGKTIAETLAVAQAARNAGATVISFNPGPLPKGARKSDAELDFQAGQMNRLAAELKKLGLRMFVHQHDPEMRENAREWRHWFRNTDPKLVWVNLDVDWVKRGGQDVMTILGEAGPRLGSLHLRSMQNGVWMEALGEGEVDYVQVAAYLRKIGFRGHLVVELAHEPKTRITRSLEENLRLSRLFAEKVFGVRA